VLIILLALLVVLLVLGVAVLVRWWTWRPVTKRRVLVQTDADVSFAGVVLSRRGPLLVLADVTVRTGQHSTVADGTVVIDRARVLWMQVA